MSTLSMERHFNAEPAKVFEHLTQMQHLLNWWGPDGTSIREHNLDFSKTGDWFAVMGGPQGGAQEVGGKVTAIDPPNWVELTLSFELDDGTRGRESIIRFEVSPNDEGGTTLSLTQSGLQKEYIEDMKTKGWSCSLLRLGILVNEN